MSTVPDTVTNPVAQDFYLRANYIRKEIKNIAHEANELRLRLCGFVLTDGEAVANATLAYRHLEDASMRLGKVLQALDGGVSVYDKATTVGAPDDALPWEKPPVNRTAEGGAIHADGHTEQGENGGLLVP
jgi:hypothetical protein